MYGLIDLNYASGRVLRNNVLILNEWMLFSADTFVNDLTSKPLTGWKKCEALVPLLIDYCLFQAEHDFCQISLKEEAFSSGSLQFCVENWLVCVYVYEYWLG